MSLRSPRIQPKGTMGSLKPASPRHPHEMNKASNNSGPCPEGANTAHQLFDETGSPTSTIRGSP
eukprot:gene732-12031_t